MAETRNLSNPADQTMTTQGMVERYGTGEGLALSWEFMQDAFGKWWKPTGVVTEALRRAFLEAFEAGWVAREEMERE